MHPERPAAAAWPALPVGLLAGGLYLSTLAHTQPRDAVAYAELAALRQLHPQHLVQHLLGWLLLRAGEVLHPGLPALAWLSGGNALAGGLGIGLCWLLAVRAGAGALLATAAAALLATSYGWWTLSTTAEVHALPVAVQVLAILLAARRPGLAGALGGFALLLHKTMVLGLPGLVLAAGTRARRLLPVAVLVAALPYGGMVGRDLLRGEPMEGAATSWLLAELVGPPIGPPPGASWVVAASGGASGAWVSTSPTRCGFGQGKGAMARTGRRERLVAWRWVQAGGALGGLFALVGVGALWGRDRALLAALLGWLLLGSGAAIAFEPMNSEYYLGPLSCAVVLAAAGARQVARGTPWPRAAAVGLALLGLAVAVAAGRWNAAAEIGLARAPAGEWRACGAPPRAR